MSQEQIDNQKKMLTKLNETQGYLMEFSSSVDESFTKMQKLTTKLALRGQFKNVYKSYLQVRIR